MLRLEEVLTGIDVTRTIAQAVAPAILVSAGGLMLLGLQNKFHNIVDRIRQLDREIMDYERQGPPDEIRRQRLRAAEAQVDILLVRCRLTRDAIFLLYIAVLFLVGATLTAALGALVRRDLGWITFLLFVGAVAALFLSNVQSIREVLQSFRVIDEEVASAREVSPLRAPRPPGKGGPAA